MNSARPDALPVLPVLVVAGSDSSGGAGLDADREALEALGVPAHYVVTAWTRQDHGGVHELGPVAPELWAAEAIQLARAGIGALKIGLLPGPAAVLAAGRVCRCLAPGTPVVLDPVLAASSGTRFHSPQGVRGLLAELLPLGLVWTPNLPELAELTGLAPELFELDLEAREGAARTLIEGGAQALVIKGGHGRGDLVCDLLSQANEPPQRLERPRVGGASMRGTGCRFASHLAGNLALGTDLPLATRRAGEFVGQCLARSLQ